jgi:AcrR family transcriptional regulator
MAEPREDRPAGDAPEQTRERIVDVATKLFYRNGYRGTSMSAIAAEVGISAPALYWHFKSKQEICFTAVYEELGHFVYALKPASEEPSAEERLGRFVWTYVLLKLRQSEWLSAPGAAGAYRELRSSLTRKQGAQIDALQRQVLDQLRGVLDDGQASGAFRFDSQPVTAFAIVTLCEYVFSWFDPGGPLDAAQVADHYRTLVLSMVGVRAADRV